MSKIGKRPIKIDEGVDISTTGSKVTASFNDNKLTLELPEEIAIKIEDGFVQVIRKGNEKEAKAKHGLYSRLISNIIKGVKEGFTKTLEFTGTGYRAAMSDNTLTLNMGYSHPIELVVPEGLSVKAVKNTISITGIEKDKVGQFAAVIRNVRPPEVYKGKGIRYSTEHIKRKAGKTAASK